MKQTSLQASVLASEVLNLATQKVRASFDIFSGWLVAGFGAALALFIANLDSVSKFLSLTSVKLASFLFLVSAVFAVADKLLAALIAAGTTAAIEGAALGKDLVKREIELDVPAFFAATENALFWPLRALAHRAFTKAQRGEFTGPSNFYTKAAQIQALFVVIQAALSLAAAGVVVNGLAV